MLRNLQILFSIITVALAVSGLFTIDYRIHASMILFLGLSMLMFGLQELERGRKWTGWMLVGVFVCSIVGASIIFMLNYVR